MVHLFSIPICPWVPWLLKWLEAGATLENLEASLHYLGQQIRLDSLSKSDRVQRIHVLFEILKESLNPTIQGETHMPTIPEIWIEQDFEKGILEGIKKFTQLSHAEILNLKK